MCTVTYLPFENGFILTSNRDESPHRSDTPIVTEQIGNSKVTFPRDLKGGSWVFKGDERHLIVLNGAEKWHAHRPPYRQSRGILAKEYYIYPSAKEFFQHSNLLGIEPFTMVVKEADNLFLFRWDEKIKSINRLDPSKPHLWSSSTLYDADFQKKREDWLRHYLYTNPEINIRTAFYIHRHGGFGDVTQNFCMNRNNQVRTVSITSIYEIDGKDGPISQIHHVPVHNPLS